MHALLRTRLNMHADEQAAVILTCLKEQHRMRGILTQSIGEHAARRSGTNDDVVVIAHALSLSG